MKNPNYWVKQHSLSSVESIRVDCMTQEAADDITRAHEACDKVGYQGSAWNITKIKRVCSTVFYFEAEKVPPVTGASFNVAFNLD